MKDRYIKKPVEVTAIQWTGKTMDYFLIKAMAKEPGEVKNVLDTDLLVKTEEGIKTASPGCYILKEDGAMLLDVITEYMFNKDYKKAPEREYDGSTRGVTL